MPGEEQKPPWKGPTRRKVQRFQVQAPLDITVLRSGIPDTVPGRSVNVGEGGISGMMAGELMPGETVGLEVRLPHAPDPFRTRAMVRYQDKLRCGLEFVGLSAEQRASIRDWAKDAKALDPDIHRSAVSGIKTPQVAIAMTNTGAENSAAPAVKTSVNRASGKAPKWGATAPTPEKLSGTNKQTRFVPGGRSIQRRRLRGAGLIVFLVVAAVAVAVFWWQWNHAWSELESGLNTEPAATAAKPAAQVPAEVMEKLLVHRVEPRYPPEARQEKLEGIIALDIVVGRDGSVVSTRALNGPDVLARAAADALRWWKFEPYRVNGEPAVVETTVAVEFKR
jgi:TonB family protein